RRSDPFVRANRQRRARGPRCPAPLVSPQLELFQPIPLFGLSSAEAAIVKRMRHRLAFKPTRNFLTADAEPWGNRQNAPSVKLAFICGRIGSRLECGALGEGSCCRRGGW